MPDQRCRGRPANPRPGVARREGIVAFAGYPLVVEEKLIGVAAMFAREPISEAAFRTMLSVSNGIALGIERKRAENQVRWLNEQLNRRLRRTNAVAASMRRSPTTATRVGPSPWWWRRRSASWESTRPTS